MDYFIEDESFKDRPEENLKSFNKITEFLSNFVYKKDGSLEDRYSEEEVVLYEKVVFDYLPETISFIQFIYLHYFEEVQKIKVETPIEKKFEELKAVSEKIIDWVKGLDFLITYWKLKNLVKLFNQYKKMFVLLLQNVIILSDFSDTLKLAMYKKYAKTEDLTPEEEIQFFEQNLIGKDFNFDFSKSWEQSHYFKTIEGANSYFETLEDTLLENGFEILFGFEDEYHEEEESILVYKDSKRGNSVNVSKLYEEDTNNYVINIKHRKPVPNKKVRKDFVPKSEEEEKILEHLKKNDLLKKEKKISKKEKL